MVASHLALTGLVLVRPDVRHGADETRRPRVGWGHRGGTPVRMEATDERTDTELVCSSRQGDAGAFRALVERHRGRAYWIAFRLIGHEEDARDLAQEAFVRVYRALDTFDDRLPFRPWFHQIVSNLAVDVLRRRGRSAEVGLGDAIEALPATSEAGPAADAERAEEAARVRETIGRMVEPYRTAIVLRDIEGLSCKEIARVTGTTHVTARWRLHRARRMFRALWEGDAVDGVEERER